MCLPIQPDYKHEAPAIESGMSENTLAPASCVQCIQYTDHVQKFVEWQSIVLESTRDIVECSTAFDVRRFGLLWITFGPNLRLGWFGPIIVVKSIGNDGDHVGLDSHRLSDFILCH